jgi:tetratricopeptide (TPR) repeat protein
MALKNICSVLGLTKKTLYLAKCGGNVSKKRKKPRKAKRPGSRPAAKEHNFSSSMPAIDPRSMEKTFRGIRQLVEEYGVEALQHGNLVANPDILNSILAEQGKPATPLEEAQELVYQAYDLKGEKRIELTKRALELSEDCADAYVLLAEESAGSWEEALTLYQSGMKAAERALGDKAFEKDVGYFWGLVETRPYMRARLGAAEALYILGRREEAIAHGRELLRLNPNDNQGVREPLVNWLIEEGYDDEAGDLLKRYEAPEFAAWCYSHALLTFRQEGHGPEAEESLRRAISVNHHVPKCLLDVRGRLKPRPPYWSPGDKNEAISYTYWGFFAWLSRPEALDWLKEMTKGVRPSSKLYNAKPRTSETSEERSAKIDIDTFTESELIDLNHRVVERLKLIEQMRAHGEMMNFRIGERVQFRPSGRPLQEGTVTKYNKKTVTVVTEDGFRWNISPALLRSAEESRQERSQDNVIELNRVRKKQ